MANPSTAPKVEPTAKVVGKTWEENVALLSKNPKMDNPYDKKVDGESTGDRKIRLRNAHRFETERGKLEDAERKATGIVGMYGRVPSVIDGLRVINTRFPNDSFKIDALVSAAEVAFTKANPERKKSANSSALYCGEVAEALRLLGFLTYDPQGESFRVTPTLKTALQLPAEKK